MLRNSFAVLLIGTWINLSALDLVAGYDPPKAASLYSAGKEVSASVPLTKDLLESGGFTPIYDCAILQPACVASQIGGASVQSTTGKIYKLLRVFLI
jgi:hypothetical protein